MLHNPPPFLSDIPPTLHVVDGVNNNMSVGIPAGEEYAAQALEVVGSAQIQDCQSVLGVAGKSGGVDLS